MLKRRFSRLNLLLLSINGMIGSAWLFAPFYAAKLAGPGVIVSWILCGLGTCLIALTFAELSVMMPVAGGTTRFAQLSHGIITGYIISWISWLSCVTMAPIETQAILQYAATYHCFHPIMSNINGTPELTHVGLLCAIALMALLSFINLKSFSGLISWNHILFWFKTLVIVSTIILIIRTHFDLANFSGLHDPTITHWQGILSAIASGGIAFAFTGFKHGVELAGEAKNPQLSIPLAIVGSLLICLLLYLGLQVAFIGGLSSQSFAHGWSTLSFSSDVAPFVGIAGTLGLALLVKFLYVDAAVSPFGAGLIYTTSTARLIYAMSKNGYLPACLTIVNKDFLPIAAIALNFIVGMLLFLPLPGWQNMVSFLVSAVVIAYAMGPIALMSLRKSLPDHKRPFKLWIAHPICLLAFYFCNLISYWTGWQTLYRLAIAVAIGFILLLVAMLRRKINNPEMGWKGLFWLIPYLGGLASISYLGSFGGKDIITFGWDFLVIGIFSIIIFYIALLTCRHHIPKTDILNMQE